MSTPAPVTTTPSDSLVTTTHVVYGLHALSLCIGAFSAASVVGSFLFGWPSIIAVILNYVKRSEARGTWLESHFPPADSHVLVCARVRRADRPSRRRFAFMLVGFATWIIGFCLLGIWASVRIARGWLRLKDHQPMPMPTT